MSDLNTTTRTSASSTVEANETSPLLAEEITNDGDDANQEQWQQQIREQEQQELELEMDIQSEVQSKYDELSHELFPKFSRKRFYFACGFGIIALIILHLFFLQRTSLSRDFRRWYGLHLTVGDVKRNYLRYSGIGNTEESKTSLDNIEYWINNFTRLNSQNPVNLVADDNLQLTSYVESNFKKFGFQTTTHLYNLQELQKPITAKIKLVDASKKNEVVYDARLLELDFDTPAYHGFGTNGSVTSDFIYANFGTNEDYQLLLQEKFTIKNKIVIIKSNLNSNLTISDKVVLAESYGAVGVINYLAPSSKLSSANSDLFSSAIPRGTLGSGAYHRKIPSILAIPISYKSVKPILSTLLDNKERFANWDYYPENTKASFKIQMSSVFEADSTRKITNIIGSLPGIFQDGCIVIGANRDSFISSSTSSNHVILLEIMRNYQRLIKLGWKPLRSIKFISWDASENGLMGSQLLTNDSSLTLNTGERIIGYINIDSDCVTGSKFQVDAHPFLHHLIKIDSKYIPIPKSLIHDDDIDIESDGISTLHHYWLKQDNVTINSRLGLEIRNSDSLILQDRWAAPIINLKFANDVKRDASVYVPNSNLYSNDWLTKTSIDRQYYYHALLIRLIGLLGVSLSERDVIDYKLGEYFDQIEGFFEEFIDNNKEALSLWQDRNVPTHLLTSWKIYQDLDLEDANTVPFGLLLEQMMKIVQNSATSAHIHDGYYEQLLQDLRTDYPWYKYPKKLVVFAGFKLTNFMLLRTEAKFRLDYKDYQYLGADKTKLNHLIYGLPDCLKVKNTTTSCFKWTTFTNLYESVQRSDFHSTIKWLVVTYEKIQNFADQPR